MSVAARAAHAMVDSPPHLIVDDTARLICAAAGNPSPLDFHLAHPGEPVLAAARVSAAARSAYTERRLHSSGIRQYVVLGSELVFDHIVPGAARDEAGNNYVRAVAAAVGAQGEPWRCTPTSTDLATWLEGAGWSTVDSTAEADSVPAGFWDRSDALRPMQLVRFTHARLTPGLGQA
ncbi:hypothetical protein [Rhodococcus sp. (in: high G+C Gram-positive bacteria)]|uniref:hypothetical protein n=1 Tax=Rhodococcus sp. TaxID=1831 RepID=UPI003B8A8F10